MLGTSKYDWNFYTGCIMFLKSKISLTLNSKLSMHKKITFENEQKTLS